MNERRKMRSFRLSRNSPLSEIESAVMLLIIVLVVAMVAGIFLGWLYG